LLLEKEEFPRFHIGESLLPGTVPLLDRLGVGDAIRSAGFLEKHAAEFVTGDGDLYRRYPFAEGVVDGYPHAFEVDRAEFDSLLLENARNSGVVVRQGVCAEDVDFDDPGSVRPAARDSSGAAIRFTARFLIDASGQTSFLARRMRTRRMDPSLKHVAVFSHYEGAQRAAGKAEGDITIVLVPGGWWWVIPLSGGRTSVGLVGPTTMLGGRKPDETFFLERLSETPYLAQRFSDATRAAPVRAASDYSYTNDRYAGDRWLLVGDAAGFVDPVFSTGVHLGLEGAFRAADCLDRALSRDRLGASSFRAYERWLGNALRVYADFVRGFYRPEFAEVMMYPSDRLQLRQAVTSVLSGYAVGYPAVTWRVAIFKAITRLNRKHRLTPRIRGRREAVSF